MKVILLLVLLKAVYNDATVAGIDGFGSYPLWRFNKYSGLVLRPVPLGLDIGSGIPPAPPMYQPAVKQAPPQYASPQPPSYQAPPQQSPSSYQAPPPPQPAYSPPAYSAPPSSPTYPQPSTPQPYAQTSYESYNQYPASPSLNNSYASYPSTSYGSADPATPAPSYQPATPYQPAAYRPSSGYGQDSYSGQPPYVPTVNIAFSSDSPNYASGYNQAPPSYSPPSYDQQPAAPAYSPTYNAPPTYEQQPPAPPAYPQGYTGPPSYDHPPATPPAYQSSYSQPPSYSPSPSYPTYNAPSYNSAANPASSVSYTISNGQPNYDQSYNSGHYQTSYSEGGYGGYQVPPPPSYAPSEPSEPTSYMSKRASAPADEAPNGLPSESSPGKNEKDASNKSKA